MNPWNASVSLTPDAISILVTHPQGDELLKARLPTSCHPRALLTLLEAMALWSGTTICAAIAVADEVPVSSDENPCGLSLWPATDLLVRLDFVLPAPHRLTLDDHLDLAALRRWATRGNR